MKQKWTELKDEHESMEVNFFDKKPSLLLLSFQLCIVVLDTSVVKK